MLQGQAEQSVLLPVARLRTGTPLARRPPARGSARLPAPAGAREGGWGLLDLWSECS